MILLEPVGLDSRNVAQAWPLIPCRSLLNMQTLRQWSHTLGVFVTHGLDTGST